MLPDPIQCASSSSTLLINHSLSQQIQTHAYSSSYKSINPREKKKKINIEHLSICIKFMTFTNRKQFLITHLGVDAEPAGAIRSFPQQKKKTDKNYLCPLRSYANEYTCIVCRTLQKHEINKMHR